MIDDAKAKMTPTDSSEPIQEEVQNLPTAKRTVNVTVELSDSLRDQVAGSETLFIYARSASGAPMPIAIKRLTADKFPRTVTLTDEDAMMEQMNLSAVEQIKVIARISQSGQAKMQKGDLFSESQILSSSSNPTITLTIDQIAQ